LFNQRLAEILPGQVEDSGEAVQGGLQIDALRVGGGSTAGGIRLDVFRRGSKSHTGGPMRQTPVRARKLVIALTAIAFALRCIPATAMTWITSEKDKDLLTGETYTYLRIASGVSGANRRFVDIVKKGDGYILRFVVPQPTNTQTTIWAPGAATSRSARELGETLSWMVEGMSQHDETPTLSKRKRHMGVTDHEAAWPIGCEGLRELVTGKTLRVVTPEFNGQFDLANLPQQLEKILGLSPKSLVKGTAPICSITSPQAVTSPTASPLSPP